jgi:hypothetical protein
MGKFILIIIIGMAFFMFKYYQFTGFFVVLETATRDYRLKQEFFFRRKDL